MRTKNKGLDFNFAMSTVKFNIDNLDYDIYHITVKKKYSALFDISTEDQFKKSFEVIEERYKGNVEITGIGIKLGKDDKDTTVVKILELHCYFG